MISKRTGYARLRCFFGHTVQPLVDGLGVSSIVLTGAISSLISYIYQLTGFQAVTSVAITTGLIYFALHWLFNKFCLENTTVSNS
ncbi:Cap15 family CBASS effector [Vibrio harveyi]|uniref:Cap15 family CBASS effector n=1 Tax=Vibrio harveyi TaxID=669 RepID=UPI0040479CBA